MTDQEYFERRAAEIQNMREGKVRAYRELNRYVRKGETVFAGSSLMENFPVNEMLMSLGDTRCVYNRGLGGFTIDEYDKVLDVCVLELEPSRLVINIGSNDLNLPGDTVENLITRYRRLLLRVREALPGCAITLLAYYPCMRSDGKMPMMPGRVPRTIENVRLANDRVRELAAELGCDFVDLNGPLTDDEGYLRADVAVDPIHFSPEGYMLILPRLLEYLDSVK